ncbi:hypothetical protein AGMMS49942_30230 [Spirochaetia bacterium]|nr:hypothetical protein AGMMS49942_30230 [Spirochaetia bacterium]
MFAEIANYLSENSFGIALAFLFWALFFNEKALQRLKSAKIRKLAYFPILGFFIQLIVGIFRITRKY